MSFLRGLLIIPPVAAGVALVYFAVSNRQEPVRVLPEEVAASARVISVKRQLFVPRISGFGTVEPSRTWSAIAQVAGRVEYVNPVFVRGGLVNRGDVLVRIAQDDYELAIAQSQANIESAEAQIEEMQLSRETTKLSLDIERASLELAEKELARQKQLVSRGTVSVSNQDDQQAAVLTQRARVQDQENKLALIPAQLKALERSKAVAEAELKIAQLNLDRTTIAAPFDGRVAEADAEISQFIATGAKMGSLDGIDASDIDVQIPPAQMGGFVRLAFRALAKPGVEPKFGREMNLLSAVVGIGFTGSGPIWEADVKRVSDTVDPETRSLGVIVSVKDPYKNLKAGVKPPLIKGMFTNVELRAPAVDDVVLLPRNAIRDGRVRVVGEDGRLKLVAVEPVFTFRDVAVLIEGPADGTRIIVSDLSPAIDGMLISPVDDQATRERLDALARPSGTSASVREAVK